MEKFSKPNGLENMSAGELLAREAQIDKAIIAAEDSLSRVSGASQESRQGDDDATEGEFDEQEFGRLRAELNELRREKEEIRTILERRRVAA